MPITTTKDQFSLATITSLEAFNHDYNTAWSLGGNWSSVNTQFETYINKYLFPKLNETVLIQKDLGNRFEWLAKEIDFIGQYSEEYVILDTVPIAMNLSKDEELMLKRNYPKIATKLYGTGILKKQKFTLNNNDNRLNFKTLADGIAYALAVYAKRLSDINVNEEKEIKATLVDYSMNVTKDQRTVGSLDDLSTEVFNAILNIQNNSDRYNEANLASGGKIGRYTTKTDLSDVVILTSDTVKTFLLDTKIANTFQANGLDLTSRIISFDDLGGTYRITEDVEVTDTDTVEFFRTYGDYQIEVGDLLPKGSVFTFDVSGLSEFTEKVEEIKPDNQDLYAYIFDINKLRYKRYTKNMLKEPFYNGEFDEVTYWIHYYSMKAISPFYNSVLIKG